MYAFFCLLPWLGRAHVSGKIIEIVDQHLHNKWNVPGHGCLICNRSWDIILLKQAHLAKACSTLRITRQSSDPDTCHVERASWPKRVPLLV